MLGYVAIGIPCGILSASIGMNALQVFMMCALFYSGAGQFMIPNMWLAGSPLASIVASVSFVNTRQMLYSAAFSPYFQKVRKWLTVLFSATVTDESFGVNLAKYQTGSWDAERATLVNLMCCFTWSLSNAVGVIVGNAISIPTAIAAFAMTSIFICLLATQKVNLVNVVVVIASVFGVVVFKTIGLGGAAILFGAAFGVLCGMLVWVVRKR